MIVKCYRLKDGSNSTLDHSRFIKINFRISVETRTSSQLITSIGICYDNAILRDMNASARIRPEIDGNAELGWMSEKKHAEIR